MTKNSPRIYVYKITFEEVPHYYYGVHLEKKFDEYYMGSPITHKNYWTIYTPKKEIIKFFDYTEGGWLEAGNYENSLIVSVYNDDQLCLNEHCGKNISLTACQKGGKIAGKLNYERKVGIHGFTKERMCENSKKAGEKTYKLGVGAFDRSKEQWSVDSKKAGKLGGKISGKLTHELGLGVHGLSEEQRIENATKGGKIGGRLAHERKVGIHGLTKDQRIENAIKGGKISSKIVNSQKWKCTVTGFVSTPGPLAYFQKKRGIDTSNRIRIS
jgi:hypothetical protein